MITIPFDIELAKFIVGTGVGKIITRRGDEVKIINWDDGGVPWSIRGEILPKNNSWWTFHEQCWAEDGRWGHTAGVESERDLVLYVPDDFMTPAIKGERYPFDAETGQLAVMAGTGRIVTREGLRVKIRVWDDRTRTFPVAGSIFDEFGNEQKDQCWTIEGKWLSRQADHGNDLFIEEIL